MVKTIALLTFIIELITVFFRFGLELKAREATHAVSTLTFGLRIHHGYIGLLVMAASALAGEKLKKYAFIAGAALFLSDLIHHFVVLKFITGSPEFDIFY